MTRSLSTACALWVATAAFAQVPITQLNSVIDLPTPDARRAAADALAKRDVSLADWVEALRAFRVDTTLEPGSHAHTVDLWNGDRLEPTRVHVYVPDVEIPQHGAPLLLGAHGTGGDGTWQIRMWRRVADELGMVVLAPAESGANGGYAFTVREREITRAAIRWVQSRHPIDPNRVYLTGVSRGGHLTWDVALRYPDLAAAIAPMIGGPRWNPDGQNNLRFLEHAIGLPIRDLQGSKDDPRLLLNLHLAFERLNALGATDAELIEFAELGHSFDLDAVDWSAFWTKRREARPDRIVRLVSNARETRSHWLDVVKIDAKQARERISAAIPNSVYRRLDDKGRRRWLCDKVEKHTARIAVEMTTPGRFRVESRHVRRFRLLLSEDMLGTDGKIRVRMRGRESKHSATPDPQVLLRDFLERLDPTFLPVAEVSIDHR